MLGLVRILVVEDEQKTRDYLKKGLTEHGFVVDVTGDGDSGLHLATTGNYDLVVLDVMLPVRDGWNVLTNARKTGLQSRVIFVTARDQVPDRVRGLELGADDYLVKPFAFSELLARIRTVLRRGNPQPTETLQAGDLEVDLIRRRATRAGKPLDLAPKEFALLALLMRRQGEVLSRTMIAEQVWDMNFDSDTNVVDVAVRRLRRKMDDPFPRKLIHTIRGAGYTFDERS